MARVAMMRVSNRVGGGLLRGDVALVVHADADILARMAGHASPDALIVLLEVLDIAEAHLGEAVLHLAFGEAVRARLQLLADAAVRHVAGMGIGLGLCLGLCLGFGSGGAGLGSRDPRP